MAASRGTNRPPQAATNPRGASAATKRRVRSGTAAADRSSKQSSNKSSTKQAAIVGRPRICWTHSQQRRLLRLYLFTPPSELPLSQILALLTEANFIPKERRTQTELRKLMSDPQYWRLRPKDRDSMRRRLEFLRAARIEAQRRRKANSKGKRPVAIDLLRSGSLVHHPRSQMATRQDNGYQLTTQLLSNQSLTGLPLAFDLADGPDFMADRGYLAQGYPFGGPSPDSIRSGSSTAGSDSQTNRTARVSFLKRLLPNRTPSFIADVASLFSGLSQKSVSSGSTKRNSASSYPSEVSSSRGWRLRRSLTPTPDLTLTPPPENEEQVFMHSESLHYPTSDHEENAAVINACCAYRMRMVEQDPSIPWCVHQRLFHAIAFMKEFPNETADFTVTKEEADVPDDLGNILLHIAALWGAPVGILRIIIKQTTNVSAINRKKETFLHVYQPSTDLPPTPAAFGSMTRVLRRLKFNFRQLDRYKRTCINRLILNPAFSLEALDAFFSEVSETTGVWLVSNRSLKGERLFHCFCRKLYDLNMEIPDSSSDGSDFLYRQQNYLQRFAAKSMETRLGPAPPAMITEAPRNISPESQGNTPPSSGGGGNAGKRSSSGSTATQKSQLTSLDKEMEFKKVLKHLMDDEYDVNEQEEVTGRTRLMILLHGLSGPGHAQHGVPEQLIRKMLQNGADLEIVDKLGNTALHYAAEYGLPAVVGLLCLYNADVTAVNRRGETPLQLTKSGIFRRDTLGGIRKWTRYLECGSILMHYTDTGGAAKSPGRTDESSPRGGKTPMSGHSPASEPSTIMKSEGSPMSQSDDSLVMGV